MSLNLRKMIDAVIVPEHLIGVYISGGLDSTILLHHLREKTDEAIYTYTFGFPDSNNEFEYAKKVSEFYDTKHREIMITNLLDILSEVLKYCERPRFNLWIYVLAKKAYEDRRKNCYVAEACDENFGGYYNKLTKSYLELWSDFWIWIKPSWEIVHRIFNINIHFPFAQLDFIKTYPYWDREQLKTKLREAYEGIIPSFVLERKKQAGSPNWFSLWERELSKHYPNQNPKTKGEIQFFLNHWVTKKWLEVRKLEL